MPKHEFPVVRTKRTRAVTSPMRWIDPMNVQWYRKSNIRKSKKISRTLALKYYKLDPSDLEGLPFAESPIAISSPGHGGALSLTVSLYSERMVERVAWTKYGGPDAFQCYLDSLRNKYLAANPLGAWEFQYPDVARAAQVEDDVEHPQVLADDRTGPRETLWMGSPPPLKPEERGHFRHQELTWVGTKARRRPSDQTPLFCHEPLVNRTSATKDKHGPSADAIPIPPLDVTSLVDNIRHPLSTFAEVYKPTPTSMQCLQRGFQALNCLWLWDAANRVLAFPANISDWHHLTQAEKETALRKLLDIARNYPPRPTSPPPASLVYDHLRGVLRRAPSLADRTRSQLILHEFFGGQRIWLWDAGYMSELFFALVAIINEHGCGEEGWMSARWEVYDTFSSSLQGLSYRNKQWYDGASDWLRGRMELPGEHAVTTRQDNTSDFGRWYNTILPDS